MRRIATIIGVVLLAGLLVAATSSAATPSERKLQSQLTTLTKQVKTLQKQVKTLQKDTKDLEAIAVTSTAYGVCLAATTADVFQGTWAAINANEAKTIFPQTTPAIGDGFLGSNTTACQGLRITRAPATATINGFDALARVWRLFHRFVD